MFLKRLTLAELFAFAGTAETVVLAFFFAWVALHETCLLEHWAEFWEFENQCARDGELDSVNLSGGAATLNEDGYVVFFLLLNKCEWIGYFGEKSLIVAEVICGGLAVDSKFTFALVETSSGGCSLAATVAISIFRVKPPGKPEWR